MAQFVTDGHKAHIDTGKKNYKTQISKQNTHGNLLQMLAAELQERNLADQEKHHDQPQGNGNLLTGVTCCMEKGTQNVLTDGVIRNLIGQVAAGENTKHQNRQNGTN